MYLSYFSTLVSKLLTPKY